MLCLAAASGEIALASEAQCQAVAAKQDAVAAELKSEMDKTRALIAKRKQDVLKPLQAKCAPRCLAALCRAVIDIHRCGCAMPQGWRAQH